MPSLIQSARQLLTELHDDGVPGVIVAFSGGKDSRVCLDLAVEVFGPQRVRTYVLYFWPGLQCEIDNYNVGYTRYGIKPILLPHPSVASYVRFSQFRSPSPKLAELIRRNLRWADIERIVRHQTGLHWIVAGHRVSDSLQRCGMLKSHRGRWEDKGRLYPIWDWKPKDVLAYLRGKKIPVPFDYTAGVGNTSGVDPGNVKCLRALRQHYPQDFKKLTTIFPDALALLERDEVRENHAIVFQKNSRPV